MLVKSHINATNYKDPSYKNGISKKAFKEKQPGFAVRCPAYTISRR